MSQAVNNGGTGGAPQVQNYTPGPLSGSTLLSNINTNLTNIAASIGQLISGLQTIWAAIPTAAVTALQTAMTAAQTAITAAQTAITALQAQTAPVPIVLTNTNPLGTSWNVADLAGYPNLGVIVVYLDGYGGNILNLPVLSDSAICKLTIKTLDIGTGSIQIKSATANIKTDDVSGPQSVYGLPIAYAIDGYSVITYGCTLEWVGSEGFWHITSNAISINA